MKKTLLPLFIFLFIAEASFSQEKRFRNISLLGGIGAGINESNRQTGFGLLYTMGWQKSLGEQNRLRINPGLMLGGFMTDDIPTDTRQQHYRMTSLSVNIHYDLIRYTSLSLVLTGGGFTNYSRGLLGTGGDPEAHHYDESEFFNAFYAGGNVSIGLRINNPGAKFAYQFYLPGIQYGSGQFGLVYAMFEIQLKLNNFFDN